MVEEELSVGKRKVANGGVRVTTSVSERPVKETVSLREEHVGAERRPADRTLSAEEAEAAFEEKTVEMMGTSEEVEVRKEARVVGEVALTKETKERQQTVSDTVRRTDVEVEEIEPELAQAQVAPSGYRRVAWEPAKQSRRSSASAEGLPAEGRSHPDGDAGHRDRLAGACGSTAAR